MWMEETVARRSTTSVPSRPSQPGPPVAPALPFCYIMLDDGVKAAGVEEDQVKVADICDPPARSDRKRRADRADALAEAPLNTPVAGE